MAKAKAKAKAKTYMEQAYQNSLRDSVEAISKGVKLEDAAKILAGIFSNKSLIQIQEDLEDLVVKVSTE